QSLPIVGRSMSVRACDRCVSCGQTCAFHRATVASPRRHGIQQSPSRCIHVSQIGKMMDEKQNANPVVYHVSEEVCTLLLHLMRWCIALTRVFLPWTLLHFPCVVQVVEHSLSYEDEDEREDLDAQEVFGELRSVTMSI